MKWIYKKLEPGDSERDPHETEFFRVTALTEVVIREFVQNSLDAKRNGNKIKVVITLGNVEKDKANIYLKDFDEHFFQCKDLQYKNEYKIARIIPFIALEDFGTTGLDGETMENGIRPSGRSNFYNFWWCEGKSKKSGLEAGRWGLGKTAFHIASKIRSFWGLTIRVDDSRELLMGKSLLRTHRIRDKVFQYAGYFAKDNFKPITDNTVIQDFKEKFSISRNNEYGFSLIIPMLHEEIKKSSIINSIIMHYFYAIMKGLLVVEIKEGSNVMQLDSNNIYEYAISADWTETPWKNIDIPGLFQFMKKAFSGNKILDLWVSHDNSYSISEDSFRGRVNELKRDFNSEKFLAFNIPVNIKKIYGKSSKTGFYIFLEKCSQLKKPEEFYIRSGITISGIKVLGNRPVRGMLVAEDEPITEFLGDAETPAHTDWNERTEDFKEKYDNAVSILRFIKKSIIKIVSFLDEPPKEQQEDFLIDIFNISSEYSGNSVLSSQKTEILLIEQKERIFNISKATGGFKIFLDKKDVILPIKATILIAYDIRRGNPFKQYDTYDFDLRDNNIFTEIKGGEIVEKKENIIDLIINDHNFLLNTTGFDLKRDIVVNIKEKKIEKEI